MCSPSTITAGISEDDQARLFKDFSRLEKHQSVEGHGLGLVIVRQMVERMGG
ncbi:MAG: ATP-binding protein [Anaerolineae bacterium]|nr:ATP-binding protein [Anaerolineae bacterium]MDW8172858.1 ATP-binding protein [Anaerolineae bacterium]